MMVMMTVVCVAFNSCGGDDDEVKNPPTNPGGGSDDNSDDSNYTYYEPYLNWGAWAEGVKYSMAERGLTLISDAANSLVYTSNDGKYGYIYYFGGNPTLLYSSSLIYNEYSKDLYNWLVKKVENKYNVKMTEAPDGSCHYCSETNISGFNTYIVTGWSESPAQVSVTFRQLK